jgi:hypothetical protein
MTALIKKTQSRFARWCKEFVAKNKPPHRWYEYDGYGIG